MALEIMIPTGQPQNVWVSDRRLWLTADESEAVEDGDPRARYLLCGGAGATLPKAQAEALGLVKAPVEPVPDPEPEVKEDPKPADKAMAKPATKTRKTVKRRKRT